MPKSICIIISLQTFVRNYLETDALDEVLAAYDVTFLVAKGVSLPKGFAAKNKVLRLKQDSELEAIHYIMFDLLMMANLDASRTFQFRQQRVFFPWFEKRLELSAGCVWSYLRFLISRSKLLCRWACLKILSSPLLLNGTLAILWAQLSGKKDVEERLTNQGIDLLLLPSSAYEPYVMHALEVASKHLLKSLFLVDNWDNLSSKTIFLNKPDHMAVWGHQSAQHAIDIQQMRPEQISVIGTPRFAPYLALRDTALPTPFPFQYILFVGTAVAFDEARAVRGWNDLLVRHDKALGGVKLIYRPHPSRQSDQVLSADEFSHVVIDPQVETNYRNRSLDFDPDLQYYPSLLANAELVTGGLTSMLIEAMLMRKHFICQAYSDKTYLANMANVRHRYLHFEGLENLPCFHYANNDDELDEAFWLAWQHRDNFLNLQKDEDLDYYFKAGAKPYKYQLLALCKRLLGETENAK